MAALAEKIEQALEPRLDARLEDAYRQHYLRTDSLTAKILAFFWLFFSLLFIYADYALLGSGQQFIRAVAVRGVLILFVLLYIAGLNGTATPAQYDRWTLAVWLAASSCVLYIQAFLRPASYFNYYAVDILIVMSMLVVTPGTFWNRIIPALYYTAGHFAIYFCIKTAQPAASVLSFVASFLIVNVAGVYISAQYYSFRRREYLARHQDAAVRVKLAELASVDELTGALNRRGFFAQAEEEFARHAARNQPFTVLAIDVDHFKVINDTFGHHCGDLVLKELCRYVRQSIRECDCFGRMGGEEFALTLPYTDGEQAVAIAERLRCSCPRLSAEGSEIAFTVSIGVAQARPEDDSVFEVQRRADAALYRAKAEGRDLVRLHGAPNAAGAD